MRALKRKGFRNIRNLAMAVAALVGMATGAGAVDQLYFTAVSLGPSDPVPGRVLLEWGELEGRIPGDIVGFNIYRRLGSGNFTQLTTSPIPNSVRPVGEIPAFFFEAGESAQLSEIIAYLNRAQEPDLPHVDVTVANFAQRLHDLLDPAAVGSYNRMQAQQLMRFNRGAARVGGRAYIDRPSPSGVYEYLLTGVIDGGGETTPLGRATVDTTVATVLPAPAAFQTVRIGTCSETRKRLDHAQIHFRWDVPTEPNEMVLRTSIYGYDLFRAETNLGPLNLRAGVPAGLVKVNDAPIIASGDAPAEGTDAFLAVDDGGVRSGTADTASPGGTPLRPGDTYYYYLAARDLSGKYSATAGPLTAVVPDADPPPMPWNVHAQREMVPGGGGTSPELALIWDQVNTDNYLAEFSRGRKICPQSTSTSVCYVASDESCDSRPPICVDLDVVQYAVFRFDSYAAATGWGADEDGDYLPREREDINDDGVIGAGESDPCDPTDPCDPSVPGYEACLAAAVPELVARFPATDPTFLRIGPGGKQQVVFRDSYPASTLNRIYWYRIAAVDPSGNFSPLAPPQRGVLWDRTQPVPNGTVGVWRCTNRGLYAVNELCLERYGPWDPDALFTVIDETNMADRYSLYEVCPDVTGRTGETATLILSDDFANGRDEVYRGDLGRYDCLNVAPGCTWAVRYFGADGTYLGESRDIAIPLRCFQHEGCAALARDCRYHEVGGGGGVVHDPAKPLELCANLNQYECARWSQEILGEMSPFSTVCNPDPTPQLMCSYPPFDTIVSDNACLGVRIFSKNHVGSGLLRMPCFNILKGAPAPPLMEGASPRCSEATPGFDVSWSTSAEGLAAFIVSRESSSGTAYESFWHVDPDPVTGKYKEFVSIPPLDKDETFTFRVRALDRTLQMSEWSGAVKADCEEITSPNLPWPRVPLTHVGPDTSVDTTVGTGQVTAVRIVQEQMPGIVLSEDLTALLESYRNTECTFPEWAGRCTDKWPPVQTCLKPLLSRCPGVCEEVRSKAWLDRYVVYRQEEGKDLVQVGPLVDMIHCSKLTDGPPPYWALADPYVYVLNFFGPGSADAGDETSLVENTIRLVFVDRYPYQAGTQVRYQVVETDPRGDEPKRIYWSQWLPLP